MFSPIGYARDQPSANVGEAIYLHGLQGSGKLLEATREAGMRIRGEEADLSNCHRRSCLGARESFVNIPPVTGRYLFHQPAEYLDLPYLESRDPYTEQTLARAIRDGLDSRGKPPSYLMPRFILDAAGMKVPVGYLKTSTCANCRG